MCSSQLVSSIRGTSLPLTIDSAKISQGGTGRGLCWILLWDSRYTLHSNMRTQLLMLHLGRHHLAATSGYGSDGVSFSANHIKSRVTTVTPAPVLLVGGIL